MRYIGTLIAVKNMAESIRFYHDVLGLGVVDDFGANVVLTHNIFLQTADTWKDFIHKQDDEIVFANNAIELYFEVDDMDRFMDKLQARRDVSYVHPLVEHNWGQRAVRFYDPDQHIIEVGEAMGIVVKRYIQGGFSIAQTAQRMDVSIDYVKSFLK